MDALQDIRDMMERSSRFISLSGWSGVSAGICGLVGAWFAWQVMKRHDFSDKDALGWQLLVVAAVTFCAALGFAVLFTYRRSKKAGVPLWGVASRSLLLNVSIPMLAGGLLVTRMITLGYVGLIAPSCLIIYGIALYCGSKQTLNEIRYLAYTEIVLGILALWNIGYGLFFWMVGFGIMHIVYGLLMWLKYERRT